MTRKKISIVRLFDTPQAQEAIANATVDQTKSFTSPTRFASQPVMGMEMALATPNEVMTQFPGSATSQGYRQWSESPRWR